jgi:hypothetical protein
VTTMLVNAAQPEALTLMAAITGADRGSAG